MRSIAGALALSLVSSSMASELNVLGIKFDEPFSGVVCPGSDVDKRIVNLIAVREPCLGTRDADNWQNKSTDVFIAINDMPYEIANPIGVSFQDGAPRTMRLSFKGISTQGKVLALLEEKFGAPTEKRSITKQNVYGAQFAVTEAKWSAEYYEVTMTTVSVERGMVLIVGPRVMKEHAERRRNNATAKPPGL